MVTYYTIPNLKINVAGTDYINTENLGVNITGFENGFDVATLLFNDCQTVNRANIKSWQTVGVYTKDATSSSWGDAVFAGVVRYATEKFDAKGGEVISAKCDGAGFGFAETLCAQEYGSQSSNPTLDTLKEIITDGTYGLATKYVNAVLGGPASGYNYDTTAVDDISGTIRYLYFPYKPNSKSLCDVCNLSQAIKGLNAGPHWIVTPANKLVVTTVGNHSDAAVAAGYTTYYAGSQANATLTQGSDFLEGSFENQSTLANWILYHSNWIWPSDENSDFITETENINRWAGVNVTVAYDNAAGSPKVGSKCIKGSISSNNIDQRINYPATGDPLGLSIYNAGGKYNKPVFGFWCKRNSDLSTTLLYVNFYDTGSVYASVAIDLTALLPTADTWAYIEFEVGPYANTTVANGPYQGMNVYSGFDWTNIANITFIFGGGGQPATATFSIDGLHFAGWVIRAASNSTQITADGVIKTRIINDPFGKDDTLNASDATGTIAQLAYSELLRAQTSPTIGNTSVPYLPGLFAGQLVHIHARPNSAGTHQIDSDFRVTQYTHSLNSTEWTTKLVLTSDVINSQSRSSYESINEANKAVRPEFQDKQATGIKMRDVDITQPILQHDYPS